LRIVLDTNVLLSGLAYPRSLPGRILTQWHHGSIEVVLSNFILDELRRVLPRLSNRHGLTPAEIDDLVDILALQAEVVEPAAVLNDECRDVDDLPILGTLIAALERGQADCLVTGDKDLLELSERYPIMSVAQFCERYGI
jgi:putative PIN family toxin of toxin-antitoxin system